MSDAIHAHESCMQVAVRVLHSNAFIMEFFHKCEEGSNQGLLAQSVYYTHMHIHCRYPDVHVLSDNMCLGTPTMGFPFTCRQKETWLLNNVQFKLILLYGCVAIRVV